MCDDREDLFDLLLTSDVRVSSVNELFDLFDSNKAMTATKMTRSKREKEDDVHRYSMYVCMYIYHTL